MKRICIFIDGSNLFHNLKNIWNNAKIDFTRFSVEICNKISIEFNEEMKLIRTYYYNAPYDRTAEPEKVKDQQKFFDMLNRLSKFETKLGRLERRGNIYVEKEVDITLAVDMLSLARKDLYDIGVLVSDDGDFKSVLHELKDIGKIPVFAGFSHTRVLLNESDLFIDLRKDVINKDLFTDT